MTPAQRASLTLAPRDEAHPGVVAFGLLAVLGLGLALGWAAHGQQPVQQRTEVKRELVPCHMLPPPVVQSFPLPKCVGRYGGECGGLGVVQLEEWKWKVAEASHAALADWTWRTWTECGGGW